MWTVLRWYLKFRLFENPFSQILHLNNWEVTSILIIGFFHCFFKVQRSKQIELIQCKNFWNKIQAQYLASVNSSRPKQDMNGGFNLVINKFSCLLFLFSFEKLQRRLILTATSALVRARYHPSQCQILTLATDGQVSYFEVIDGTEIRNIVLGKHSTVTSLDVSPGQGENFITSTNDSLVKVILIT